MFGDRVTHVIFEEPQPLAVFAFGFPHFDQRLNLREKKHTYVVSHHKTCETVILEESFYYLHNRGNIFLKHIHPAFVQLPLLESFPTSLLGNYQMCQFIFL